MPTLTPTNLKFFKTPAEFRKWLHTNHADVTELWLAFYKKDSGRASVTYSEALDEALCYGWIDGVRKAADDISYTQRFTPRKPKSIWSLVNIRRVNELTQFGRMTAAGLTAFKTRDEKRAQLYSYENHARALGEAYEKRFRANKKAWAFYEAQAPWYRRTSSFWVTSAKQEETRLRRLEQLIACSAKGERIPQLISKKKS
ncbi:MAG: YdeI/OmpD-associated family protein [Candidatus Korobacteraceae bacterium]